MARALLVTVGTGDVDALEQSLLAPLRKSLASGAWDRVVLLPSHVTRASAELLEGEGPGGRFEVCPLPAAGQEEDADSCFRHFEAQIERLLRAGFAAGDILVDFTRGTKAMSAALVLAALSHGLPRLRYITGTQRDHRGMVVAGSETIRETSPLAAIGLRRIELAHNLIAGGAYAAALDLLPRPDPRFAGLQVAVPPEALVAMRNLAGLLAAWDRLDYRAAAGLPRPRMEDLPARWRPLCPDRKLCDWIDRLARQPPPDDMPGMAAWLRPLAIDLLANAERRARQHQFEDALVRSYRVLEMVGQARLFDHGISSDAVPADHAAVVKLRRDLAKSGSNDFSVNRKGELSAPRYLTARLLGRLGDPFGKRLENFDKSHGSFDAETRNTSVLIHGFDTKAPARADQWSTLFAALWTLLEQDREAEPGAVAEARRLTSILPGSAGSADG